MIIIPEKYETNLEEEGYNQEKKRFYNEDLDFICSFIREVAEQNQILSNAAYSGNASNISRTDSQAIREIISNTKLFVDNNPENLLIGAGNYIINNVYYDNESYLKFLGNLRIAFDFNKEKIKVRIMTGTSGIGKSSFWRNLYAIDYKNVLSKGSFFSSIKMDLADIKPQGIIIIGYENSSDEIEWSAQREIEELHKAIYKVNGRDYNSKLQKIKTIKFDYAKQLLEYSIEINSPVIVVFDNLDLCADKYVENVLKFVFDIKDNLIELQSHYPNSQGILLVVNTRPDTFKYYKKSLIDPRNQKIADEIPMPEPDVYRIVRNNFYIATKLVCRRWKKDEKIFTMKLKISDRSNGDYEIYDNDIEIKSIEELADFIIREAFEKQKDKWTFKKENPFSYQATRKNFLNMEFDKFISRLMDHDVRRFDRFITYCFKEGTYFPFKDFALDRSFAYKRYDFLRILILGTKSPYKTDYEDDLEKVIYNRNKKPYLGYVDDANYYEYNEYFERDLKDSDNVIMFNIFETFCYSSSKYANRYHLDTAKKIANGYENVFFLYIRILQRMWLLGYEGEEVSSDKLISDLKILYDNDEKIIEAALNRMIFNGFILEKNIGSRKQLKADDVKLYKVINGKTEYAVFAKVMKNRDKSNEPNDLDFHCAAALYISELITEYQYIYQMGVYYITEEFSAMRDPNKNMQNIDYRIKSINTINKIIPSISNPDEYFEHQYEEYTVTLFLIAVVEILKYNITSYNHEQLYCLYENILDRDEGVNKRTGKYNDPLGIKNDKYIAISPISRMIKGVIGALEGKISAADGNDRKLRSSKLSLLRDVLISTYIEYNEWLSKKLITLWES